MNGTLSFTHTYADTITLSSEPEPHKSSLRENSCGERVSVWPLGFVSTCSCFAFFFFKWMFEFLLPIKQVVIVKTILGHILAKTRETYNISFNMPKYIVCMFEWREQANLFILKGHHYPTQQDQRVQDFPVPPAQKRTSAVDMRSCVLALHL